MNLHSAIAAAMLCVMSSPALAGAWTLPEESSQIIATTIVSTASTEFNANGEPYRPVKFRKLLQTACIEYGWKDWLTLTLDPEYARAISAEFRKPVQHATDFAVGGGLRARLTGSIGVLSLEATVKSAGTYDMSTAIDLTAINSNPLKRDTSRQAELRLLYGTNFTLFGRSGYFDSEVAQRWIANARPDETAIDFTVGYDIGWHTQAMLQSFNLIAAGNARPPYSYYRSHKLALSAVTHIWRQFSLQTGTFFSPAGQNALAEQGAFVALWVQI